jgi:hypothetical protein
MITEMQPLSPVEALFNTIPISVTRFASATLRRCCGVKSRFDLMDELPAHAWSEEVMLFVIAAAVTIALGLDLYLPVHEKNPLTAEKIEQGGGCFSTAAFRAIERSQAPRATIQSGRIRTDPRCTI